MLSLACCGTLCCAALSALAQTDPAAATAEDEDARKRAEILASPEWQSARARFAQWLTVQKVYGPNEIEALKSELRNRVDLMSAQELAAFTVEMQAKLDVLLDPTAAEARRWVDTYFTPKKQQELAAKYGVTDPMRVSSQELEAALDRFAADRRIRRSGAAAQQQAQQAQVRGAQQFQRTQAQNQAQARATRPSGGSSFGSHYAPTKPRDRVQTYEAPYKPVRYTVGPWGGVWMGR
jgi:hypothetical protein